MTRHIDPNETKEERHTREAKAEQNWRENNVLIAFWATLAAGIATLLGFGWLAGSAPQPQAVTVGLLAGAAAALLGALLGFLFGLPPGSNGHSDNGGNGGAPANAAASMAATQQRAVNNNLLEISDWLTKIIVGAGLVGLTDLVRWIGQVGSRVGAGAGLANETAAMFGGAILVFFFTWGFLFVYIQTRTIISVIFASTERSLQGVESARRARSRQTADPLGVPDAERAALSNP
jgi:hypothetical protein